MHISVRMTIHIVFVWVFVMHISVRMTIHIIFVWVFVMHISVRMAVYCRIQKRGNQDKTWEGAKEKWSWIPTTETHKDVANNINIKVLMAYMADDRTEIIPPTHPDNNEIVDSGTTGNFPQNTSVWMNLKLTKYPLSVTLTDGSRIKLTRTSMLSLQNLPESARREHILT